MPGIGPLTASALGATLSDVETFVDGRSLAAYLSLVPRQHSTGGKSTLLGISERGDHYPRTLLIHCARAVIRHAEKRQDALGAWIRQLLSRRSKNVVAVALANKNARIVWALLKHQRDFQTGYQAGTAA